MKTLLLFSIALLILSCSSNKLKNKIVISDIILAESVLTKMKELDTKNLDYLVLQKFYNYYGYLNSLNNFQACNNCSSNTFYYVIWKENNENVIQKFDNCGTFYFQKLLDDSIIDFFINNFDEIKKENVKLYEVGNGKIMFEIHTEFRDFLIKRGNKLQHKNFDVLNLVNDEKSPNLNYDYNNNLKIVKLNRLIADEIKTNDSLKTFKRDFATCK